MNQHENQPLDWDRLPRLSVSVSEGPGEERERQATDQVRAFAAQLGAGQPFAVFFHDDDPSFDESDSFDVLLMLDDGTITNWSTQTQRDLERGI